MLSIIIPVYNEEKTIESMIRQFETLREPHEVIVSDTSSTDKTVIIARQFADVTVTLEKGREPGVSTGRNAGAAAASGDFLVFMDCGVMIPDVNAFFTTALARFQREPDLVGVSVRIDVDEAVCTPSDAAVSDLMNGYFWFLNKFLGVGMATGKFQMVRTGAFQKIGGFNEHLHTAEDVDFFGRLRKIGRTAIMWDLVAFHPGRRFHARGAWRTLFLWMKNGLSYWIFKKPAHTWEPIR